MTSREFVGSSSCVAEARRFVRLELHGKCGEEPRGIAVLLTSELASNVVLHAGTAFEVIVEVRDAVIRVEIHDGAAVTQAFRDLVERPPAAVDVMAVGGRGIMLVGMNALRFGLADKGQHGKAVWFELPCFTA